jgi:hypothetical protein
MLINIDLLLIEICYIEGNAHEIDYSLLILSFILPLKYDL